ATQRHRRLVAHDADRADRLGRSHQRCIVDGRPEGVITVFDARQRGAGRRQARRTKNRIRRLIDEPIAVPGWRRQIRRRGDVDGHRTTRSGS
ncbi:MAG: hypothetical protein H7338_10805, partial [Candidatus Sericytochromatia bacterium]|nr:hypothetical protein [Candidatus Sericytochromatia bacterium]